MAYTTVIGGGISRPMFMFSRPDDATLARIDTIRMYEIQLGYRLE